MVRFKEATKNDPYRNFNFKIYIDAQVVAACKKMSKISASVDVVKFRSGNATSAVSELIPGRVAYDPITLENGLTNDKTFQEWATTLMRNEFTEGARKTEPGFRKNIKIEVLDIDNKSPVRTYTLHNAWCSKYTALSDLVGDANDIIIESLELQYEGFVREDNNVA